MTRIRILAFSILFVILPVLGFAQQNSTNLLDGDTWKQQGLEVISAWMNHATDSTDGHFHAFLDREWNPHNGKQKYPGMLSRHLFSYSVAYMLSGNEKYLEKADKLFNYLINHGWDEQFGGWYYSINPQGQPVDSKKDMFMNIYAVTGLSMYYTITHDKSALEYIRNTRSLFQEHAWDSNHGGYYRRLDRQWKVTNNNKVFTPQIAPVSGYLLYLYAATQQQRYLDQAKKLMALANKQLLDNKLGWIREKFDRSWQPLAKHKSDEQINIGHNIEVAWMWLRLYSITGNTSYKKKAEQLYRQLHQSAFKSNGAWLSKMGLTSPDQHPSTTSWWIQAYGDMLQLSMYGYGNNSDSLDQFTKGSSFWNSAFLDKKYGGTMLSAMLDGEVDRGDKAVRTKTSYHAMEHALLNYLYLSLWNEEKQITLYFNWDMGSDDRPLCPLPIYNNDASITGINTSDGSLSVPTSPSKCISVPEEFNGSIKLTME